MNRSIRSASERLLNHRQYRLGVVAPHALPEPVEPVGLLKRRERLADRRDIRHLVEVDVAVAARR